MKENTLHIHPSDNVAVALTDLAVGQIATVAGKPVTITTVIGRGHKFALKLIKTGENILKFSQPIGHATEDIPAGAKVHVHNVKTNLDGVLSYTYQPALVTLPAINDGMTFDGFVRSDGEVGIRNKRFGSFRRLVA